MQTNVFIAYDFAHNIEIKSRLSPLDSPVNDLVVIGVLKADLVCG